MLTRANEDLKYYTIEFTDNCLGEDNTYGVPGYAIINKSTKIVEHTSMVLPAAIFQAQHFDNTLKGLLEERTKAQLVDMPTGDVLPN